MRNGPYGTLIEARLIPNNGSLRDPSEARLTKNVGQTRGRQAARAAWLVLVYAPASWSLFLNQSTWRQFDHVPLLESLEWRGSVE